LRQEGEICTEVAWRSDTRDKVRHEPAHGARIARENEIA
jgi:hypothetical protein